VARLAAVITACIAAGAAAAIPIRIPAGILMAAVVILGGGCDRASRKPSVPPAAGRAVNTLVVVNSRDPSSVRIGERYRRSRQMPASRVVAIDAETREEITRRAFEEQIRVPVEAALRERALTDSIDFIVLARGIPLRIRDGGWSVDAFLGGARLGRRPVRGRHPDSLRTLANPYFGRNEPFSSRRHGFYLVTRLDGYTEEDAIALIERSEQAEARGGALRAGAGLFLLDIDPARDASGYRAVNDGLRRAAALLRGRSLAVELEETRLFSGGGRDLAGYYSWGSNDGSYDPAVYRALRFLPGAIAETAVSTSARTFRPATGGQSLVADLIAGGVTGVKGYVSEPLSLALCPADILFDRYTAGYTLAESFYMATPLVLWKDVVIGDPLCAPYARERTTGNRSSRGTAAQNRRGDTR